MFTPNTAIMLVIAFAGLVGCVIAFWHSRPPKSRLEEWRDSLQTLWGGNLEIEFEYKKYQEPEEGEHYSYSHHGEYLLRRIRLEKIVESSENKIYLYGFCHMREEYRHFDTERIKDAIYDYAEGRACSVVEFVERRTEIGQKRDERPVLPEDMDYFDSPVPEILFDDADMDFCLTGVFSSADREDIELALCALGSRVVDKPSEDGCYLLVGALPSKKWKMPFAGEKILEAVALRKKGRRVHIICENTFMECLERELEKIRQERAKKKTPAKYRIDKEKPRSYAEDEGTVEEWWVQECLAREKQVEETVQKARAAWTVFWEGALDIHFGYLNGPSRYRTDVILTRIMRGQKYQFFLQGYSTHHGAEAVFLLDAVTSKIRVYSEKRYFHAIELIGFLHTFFTQMHVVENDRP